MDAEAGILTPGDQRDVNSPQEPNSLCAHCIQILSDLSEPSVHHQAWDYRFTIPYIAASYAAVLNPISHLKGDWQYHRPETGSFVADVGKRFREPQKSACTLCHLLWASRVGTASEEIQDDYEDEIRSFILPHYFLFNYHRHANSLSLREQKLGELVFLAVVPVAFAPASSDRDRKALEAQTALHGCLVISSEHSTPTALNVVPVPPHFQPSAVLGWLRYCREHHGTLCQQKSESVIAVEGFRWIDCLTRSIQLAREAEPYVALSYVWGTSTSTAEPSSEDQSLDQASLPAGLPAVIEDAMSVTKSLGFRYLWVDKYCINQQNQEMKLKQIQQMDIIYQQAEITIIAAAGEDERHGLPGVGGKERTKSSRSTAKFRNIRITSTLKDPQTDIRNSRWFTRGWTFQEGLLSRRRLVFTEDQVYFECNAMNWFESLSGNLDVVHRRDKSRADTFMRPGLFSPYRKPSHTSIEARRTLSLEEMSFPALFESYLAWSEQYCARELRFDGDSLNAFTGLMRRFERIPKPLLQRRGIPFPHPSHGLNPSDAFVEALSWRHKHSCWGEVSQRARRRAGFPSWSWAGWAAEIEYPTKDLSNREGIVRLHVLVRFRRSHTMTLAGQGPRAWPPPSRQDLYSVLSSDDDILTMKALRIATAAFEYDAQMGGCKVHGYPATVSLSEGSQSASELFSELRRGKQWACVLLGSLTVDAASGGVITALILKRRQGGETYARAGLLTMRMASLPVFAFRAKIFWETYFKDAKEECFRIE